MMRQWAPTYFHPVERLISAFMNQHSDLDGDVPYPEFRIVALDSLGRAIMEGTEAAQALARDVIVLPAAEERSLRSLIREADVASEQLIRANLALVFVTGITAGGLSCLAVQGGLLATAVALWVAAFVALGLRFGWVGPFVVIKPSLGPLALAGIHRRSC